MNSKETDNLLPCPFCGDEDPFVEEKSGNFEVICRCCLASTMYSSSKEWVVRCWNSRSWEEMEKAINEC